MRPIQTIYKGYRFRSRTEARWAVFFDALGLRWEYEPEGFELSDGTRYLSDFWLPKFEGGCYVEVKGCSTFSETDFTKAIALTCLGQQKVLCVWGQPDAVCYRLLTPPSDCPGWNDADAFFCSKYLPGGSHESEMRMYINPGFGDEPIERAGPLVEHAISAARGARFEYGESGAAS